MLYEVVIKITLLYFLLHIPHSKSHLKDMGEVTRNWTKVLYHIEKRIVGGSDTSKKDFPFSVQFFNFGGLCGGSILTMKTVLTAAHCFDSNKNLAEMKIFSNPRFLFDFQSLTHDVWHFEIHKDYGGRMVFSHDIAVIIIHDSFKFGPQVQKVKFVDTADWMRENETFVVNGWGETKYGEGLNTNNLKKVQLYYVSRQECMIANRIKLDREMFCLHGDGVRDTCRGDSGGGVLWKDVLVGIVSYGRGCAKAPGVYVNIYYHRLWIHETINRLYELFCDFHDNKAMK